MIQAKFSIGQRIIHCMFDYRGVIIDADADFKGSQDWYATVARSRPPKDEPWYHVLVHDSDTETYVAERNLMTDGSDEPVVHPLINEYFDDFQQGIYLTGRQAN